MTIIDRSPVKQSRRTDADDTLRTTSAFLLLKGMSNKDAPGVRVACPDSERKDHCAGARGEAPVLEINPNQIKDQVYGMLGGFYSAKSCTPTDW